MQFQAAYSYLKRGHKVKLPEWGGYWYWDKEKQTIIIHTRYGEELDIRETKDVDYTFSFLFRNDWELVDGFDSKTVMDKEKQADSPSGNDCSPT